MKNTPMSFSGIRSTTTTNCRNSESGSTETFSSSTDAICNMQYAICNMFPSMENALNLNT